MTHAWTLPARQWTSQQAKTAWTPAIDVREDSTAYYLLADLPGVSREQLSIELEDGLLSLSAQRQAPQDTGEWRWKGRSYGSFSRNFRLPRNADADSISAELKDGVLKVTLPKLNNSVSRKVSVV
jgi:HSP20 family protein